MYYMYHPSYACQKVQADLLADQIWGISSTVTQDGVVSFPEVGSGNETVDGDGPYWRVARLSH